jgi:molybdenum cofactor cytidylyltransferase
MGRPKQLLPFRGKSLLAHAVDVALGSAGEPVILVLGSGAPLLEKEIDDRKIHIEENKEWREGMASSLRCGVRVLTRMSPSAEGVIIMVCDQPFVSPGLLNELIRHQWHTGKPIVASSYDGIAGAPAFFHRSLFPELLQLTGDAGARKIIQQRRDDVATISFQEGKIDIDTEEDYNALQ